MSVMPSTAADPAVALSFVVRVDDHDLGVFTTCEGLGVEVTLEQREEGGNQFFVHQLPGRLKYSNIRFTRPVNESTATVAAWFSGMATAPRHTNGQVVAMTAGGQSVAQWGLIDVIPVKWTGPQFSVDQQRVATETLEIAHHGFFEPGRVVG